jgi:prepilin-type processing-associated H-X9-DG protein
MRTRTRPAFTLFQLLIILAILAILLGLLLPAVARTREAAARMQSQNNMKQIGLAIHNYHDVNGFFPSGNNDKNYSASAVLLPYIEQDNLYKLIDFTKEMDDKANDTVRKTIVKTFLNPMDPGQAPKEFGATNYLYSAGSQASLTDNDGVFYQNSKLRLTDVTDGTSNTLMTGETLKGDGGTKAVDVKRQHVLLKKDDLKGIKADAGVQDFKDSKNVVGDRCASWMDGRFLQGTYNGMLLPNDEKPDVNCAGAGGVSALRSLGEKINVGFCDGSVRAINTKFKPEIWKALMTRAGGEVIPNDF